MARDCVRPRRACLGISARLICATYDERFVSSQGLSFEQGVVVATVAK